MNKITRAAVSAIMAAGLFLSLLANAEAATATGCPIDNNTGMATFEDYIGMTETNGIIYITVDVAAVLSDPDVASDPTLTEAIAASPADVKWAFIGTYDTFEWSAPVDVYSFDNNGCSTGYYAFPAQLVSAFMNAGDQPDWNGWDDFRMRVGA